MESSIYEAVDSVYLVEVIRTAFKGSIDKPISIRVRNFDVFVGCEHQIAFTDSWNCRIFKKKILSIHGLNVFNRQLKLESCWDRWLAAVSMSDYSDPFFHSIPHPRLSGSAGFFTPGGKFNRHLHRLHKMSYMGFELTLNSFH